MIIITRILIVDDNALFRNVLRDFLSQEPDFHVVAQASNLREAIRAVGTLSPDLVLTDLTMPDAHGIEAVTEMKRHHPDVKILVISLHRENEYKNRCRNAGAVGYIAKDAIHDELLDGIRTISSGKTHLSVACADGMVRDFVVGSAPINEGDRYFLR